MKKIIHVSDIHFGKIDKESADFLLSAFMSLTPDLVIVSGDLTQRATPTQFKEAKQFLTHLKKTGINHFVIPGNHDIEPFHKPALRILNPYRNYKKYISGILEPVYSDDDVAIASINTTRYFNLKHGNISPTQISKLEKWFSDFPSNITKIIVSHHPFDLPLPIRSRKLARRASGGMKILSTFSIDIYLSGHYHRSSVVTTSERYKKLGYSALAIQAGTVSRRQRGEVQSFNVLTINKPNLKIETYLWSGENLLFTKSKEENFELLENAWKKV